MTQPRRIMPLPLGGEHGLPYSRGLMARALMAVGVAADRAYALARRVGDDLASRGSDVVELDRLEALAADQLGEVDGREAVRQLRRYQLLRDLDLPVVILVGGATGTGKSTVATEIAYRLGITRVTSTDFIRQTMRAFFTPEAMPAIHQSSFEGEPLLETFIEQSETVLVGVRASIERALHEGWSIVLEGVHLVPGLVPLDLEGALVSSSILHINDETAHAQLTANRATARRTTYGSGLAVYGKARRPCPRCRTSIAARRDDASRTTYWCPRCQPEPVAGDG